MVKQLLEELQNNFSDHSVAISNKKSIQNQIFLIEKNPMSYIG